jgi:hypothetical protein
MSEQGWDLRGWLRMSEWRATTTALPDADVQGVVDALAREAEFEPLLTGRPSAAPLRALLHERAVAALLAQGRDAQQRPVVEDYVRQDLWARFPIVTPGYAERLDTLLTAGYIRVPPDSADRDRERLSHRTIGWAGSGVEHRSPEARGIPARIELERYRGHVAIATLSWSPGIPGDRAHPPRFETRRSILDSAGEVVELDVGALAPEQVRDELRREIHRLALSFRDWQLVLDHEAYNVSMHLGHMGREPMPPVDPAELG